MGFSRPGDVVTRPWIEVKTMFAESSRVAKNLGFYFEKGSGYLSLKIKQRLVIHNMIVNNTGDTCT